MHISSGFCATAAPLVIYAVERAKTITLENRGPMLLFGDIGRPCIRYSAATADREFMERTKIITNLTVILRILNLSFPTYTTFFARYIDLCCNTKSEEY